MKKEVADKWIEALRSGKYKQGTGSLKTIHDEFCCLGVLCDISNNGEFIGFIYKDKGGNDSYNFNNKTLSPLMRDWSGIKHPEGFLIQKGTYLSVLNDNGTSFSEIADIIEQNWEQL